MLAYLGIVLISFLISGLWSKYIEATAASKAEAAAAYDLLLMLASSATYQIWALERNSFKLLVVGDVAAALGTYAFIKYLKSTAKTKKPKAKTK